MNEKYHLLIDGKSNPRFVVELGHYGSAKQALFVGVPESKLQPLTDEDCLEWMKVHTPAAYAAHVAWLVGSTIDRGQYGQDRQHSTEVQRQDGSRQ